MTTFRPLLLALAPVVLAAGLGAPLALAATDGPPRLDVASTCRSSASVAPDVARGSDGCMRSENEAKATLDKRWADFNGDAKRQCSLQSQAGGFPSYVELLTCLELASGTGTLRSGDPGTTGSVTGRGAADVTPDADPRTRINPIEVLGKPTGGD